MRKIEETLGEKFKVEKYQFVEDTRSVMRWEGVSLRRTHILISQFDMRKTSFNFIFQF